MSMFYCEFHNETEDSDVVGFNETDFGHYCDDGAASLEPFESERPEVEEFDEEGNALPVCTEDEPPFDGFLTDAEADADVLSSAEWGTDEDYGYFGDE